ncbi:MAG: DivIVA domain-containing protein [Firmicutes bacterium]|nr:DivIVA domain-containing protein [Bacillota bacterium]
MLTPIDLENVFFRRGVRGYRVSEVQEFMSRLTQDYEHLYRENIELKEQIETLNNKLNQYILVEETLRNTMLMAQETAEEVKTAAKKQAELIIQEAKDQAEDIKRQIRVETENELKNLAILKNQTEFFRCQFKSFLNGLLEIADRQLDLNVIWEQVEKRNPEAARVLRETNQERAETGINGVNKEPGIEASG